MDFSIFNGDSNELINDIPDDSVDLILTDPPYNIALYSTGNISFTYRSDLNNDIAEWDEKPFDPASYLNQFKRVLKSTGNIFVFTGHNLIGKWHEIFDPEFDSFQFMVWHKTNPTTQVRKVSFLNSCELIVCMWNKGHTWNFTEQKYMHNFIEAPICMGKERLKGPDGKVLHPTQKPLKVLNHIVRIASNPGDVVLDPFMGVGSTGVASLVNERKFIGIELNAEYYKAAERRLDMVLK